MRDVLYDIFCDQGLFVREKSMYTAGTIELVAIIVLRNRGWYSCPNDLRKNKKNEAPYAWLILCRFQKECQITMDAK